MNTDSLKHMAYLFYAIAKADKSLSIEEYETLCEVFDKQWNHIGYDAIAYMKQQFNILQMHDADSKYCFDEFVQYLNNHPDVFTEELQSLLLKTANAIAYAYAKINKSELIYMAKLSLAFKNISG